MKAKRSASVRRSTKETDIVIELFLDGSGEGEAETGVGFFDHMLLLFAKHGFFDLKVSCKGDLDVDAHHSVEDVGICLGEAFKEALGERSGIARYGVSYVPMDEALARTVLDLSGRGSLVFEGKLPPGSVGDFPLELAEDFFRAFAVNCGANLHLDLIRGRNSHHCVEALFKSVAKALDQASSIDPRVEGILSTKGKLG